MRKILILAANPSNTARLRLNEEVRDIQEGLRRSLHRDEFELAQRWAVRPLDLQRAMLDERPQIVHFSGHGEGEEGLAFEDNFGNAQLVSSEALSILFELFSDQVECIVLNGCYSQKQAAVIVEHIDYVIGMSQAIKDTAAIDFAVGFYDALGAGRHYEFAHRLACAAIRLNLTVSSAPQSSRKLTPIDGPSAPAQDNLIPVLLKRPGLPEYDSSSDSATGLDSQSESQQTNSLLEPNLADIERAGQDRLRILDRQIAEEENKLRATAPENLQEALEWLKNNQSLLPHDAFKYALAKAPDVLGELSEDEKEDFQWDLEKYIESIYFATLSGSFYLLDEPVIGPSISSPEAYQMAFTFIKKKVPGRLGEEALNAIAERLDYLLERLFIA